MHAVPIAKKIPQGKLFCFEPQRIIFQTLCANLALNNLTNVHAYNQGVSHEQSLIEIPSSDYNTDWNYGSFSLDKGFDTENKFEGIIHKEYIYLTSIDNHPEIQKLPSLKLLKIDAEGFELNVLHGARSTIAKYLPVIFVEAHIHQSQELIHYLNALDYECYWFISDRYQENRHLNVPIFLLFTDYSPNKLNSRFLTCCFKISTNSSTLNVPKSAPLRVRTAILPSAISLSPQTSI
ncbi:methyltransferase, FkbM family [Canicola haemoglobinophilus]|uniref:Methyltransferase, FkbM family n=1 Tax=Canicola haemoglobinophilus TaxID=733 RepID=A0A377HVT0_9PAST|nr:methyltransferase, FkbM family [Canicola haemoglobinophilus]STO60585.1 methyltransferase, FkbM family [Canicola haemoglobinophilus]STO68511.1 methyltransferase, FkbM family [Canicola haemoglobinophilus]